MRLKFNPATGDVHHVPDDAPGYDGHWHDLGPVPDDYSPYTRRFDPEARAYVEDTTLAERRLRSVRGEYKRGIRVEELADLSGVPADVVAKIEAERSGAKK